MKTYRITCKADVDFYIPSGYTQFIHDQHTDTEASTETETVAEFTIEDQIAPALERILDDSPAVIRWEESHEAA